MAKGEATATPQAADVVHDEAPKNGAAPVASAPDQLAWASVQQQLVDAQEANELLRRDNAAQFERHAQLFGEHAQQIRAIAGEFRTTVQAVYLCGAICAELHPSHGRADISNLQAQLKQQLDALRQRLPAAWLETAKTGPVKAEGFAPAASPRGPAPDAPANFHAINDGNIRDGDGNIIVAAEPKPPVTR